MGQYIILGLIVIIGLLIITIVSCIRTNKTKNRIALSLSVLAFILCIVGLKCYFQPFRYYFSEDYIYRIYPYCDYPMISENFEPCENNLSSVSLRRQMESYDGYFKTRTDGSGYFIIECIDANSPEKGIVGNFVVGIDSLHPSVYIPMGSDYNRRKYDILEDDNLSALREQLILSQVGQS